VRHAAERLTRFRIEMEALRRWQHPNLLPICDLGGWEGWPNASSPSAAWATVEPSARRQRANAWRVSQSSSTARTVLPLWVAAAMCFPSRAWQGALPARHTPYKG
jgi:hypothetical protein